MDDSSSLSPVSSSASDSDAYNTESARLYFGPINTPERNFVASNRRLFPPQLPYSLRRSPRLSSPRPHPPNTSSTIDQETAAQEAQDIDLVAELVNEVGVGDDEQMLYPLVGTPPRVEEVDQDEPLSALADKILHAVDNPSPPPSPATALKMFDPYHPANLSDSAEYEGDFRFPLVTQDPAAQDNPLITLFDSSDALNQDLIIFDPPPDHLPSFNRTELLNPLQQPMSVDDLLASSPDSTPLHRPSLNHAPALLIEEPKCDVGEDFMSVDSPNKMHGEGRLASDHASELQEAHIPAEPHFSVPTQNFVFPEDTIVTPLRRSTRPRKSVVPTPSPQPLPVVTGPSIARTSIKKKDPVRNLDEDADNSQDERDNSRKSPSRALPSTPRRSRSPSKEPLLFHRELGSLSPTSASVLSSLAFNSVGEAIGSPSRSVVGPPPVLSFSVFAPSGGTFDDMSTPVRTDGPKRVPSSPKIETSPRKFRLQAPSPNDVMNTPARRILIEQAIAEGHLSPEKAAKIGFKADTATSIPAAVSTPARRVLISEKCPTPGVKPAKPKFESPVKPLVIHKILSAPRPAIPSLKGKEKAVIPAHEGPSVTVIKSGSLPFPIVASSVTVESQVPPLVQNLPKSDSSRAKSALKVSSKIPRISKKPYARKVTGRSTSAARYTTDKQADSGKSSSTLSADSSTTKRPIRLVETANIPVNSVSRSKPTVSTSSTSTILVKRKREEISSPSKPQITVLRQVPSSTNRRLLAGSKTQANDKEPAPLPPVYDTIRVRRVVTLSPPEHPVPEPHEDPPSHEPRVHLDLPSSLHEGDELPPASPMKQDHFEEQQPELSSKLSSVPSEASPLVSESGTSGLRRTTRPRRPVNPSDNGNVARKAPRRKAATNQFDDVFSGMSITALKELTTTNTEKNQHYVAAKLETEVVRKVGLRPESPAVKIRTIVQRQQEEKERQRAERAKRRARRSGNNDSSTSDIASSDVGYSSPTDVEDVDMDTNFDGDALKHKRGAGDDEDYETPERPSRDVRARLFADESGDMQPDRRVKWDRGLFTLAYLDEVKLGSRLNLKENRTLKGILAPASKALRLDTLGNLLHADTPLSELVPENVTVKKFVYDNDVPAPEPPAPKITRSKSKRK